MTSSKEKKVIFWFEDQSAAIESYLKEIRGDYEVVVSADINDIKQNRDHPINLLIMDIMIHPNGSDHETKTKVNNLHFEGIYWKDTGLEFLRRIRLGEYEQWGILQGTPIIVHTAVVDYQIEEQAMELQISAFLKKPCSLSDLEAAIINAMGNSAL